MKLADTPPTFCASCHCQQPDKKHVDFEAYYDGPVVDGLVSKQPIDDLILCEDCLGAGATLLGWVHKKSMIRENYELGKAIEEKDEYIQKMEKLLSDLEASLGVALTSGAKRGRGRPVVRTPEEVQKIRNELQVA